MCSKHVKKQTHLSQKNYRKMLSVIDAYWRENPKIQIPHIENSLYIYIVYISIGVCVCIHTHIAVVKIPTLDIFTQMALQESYAGDVCLCLCKKTHLHDRENK